MVYDPALTPERLAQIKNGTLREDLATLAPSLRLTRDDPQAKAKAYRPDVLYKNPLEISRRWSAAVARFYRILQGAGKANNPMAAAQGAEHSKLAVRAAETYWYFMTRAAPPPPRGRPDHNPFRHLSDRDASRKFMRIVEDIADASTGVLGSWFTK